MITGAHVLLYSTDANADRTFLREVLGWPYVPAAGADDPWLVFKMPPSEAAVHPTDRGPSAGLYLMCDDIERTVADLTAKGARFTGVPTEQSWGTSTSIVLPSGAEVGLYEPTHATAHGSLDEVIRHADELAEQFDGVEPRPGDEHDPAF